MNFKHFFTDFAIVFVVALVVNVAVALLYGIIVHGTQTVQWESSISIALGVGIALPLVQRLEKRERTK